MRPLIPTLLAGLVVLMHSVSVRAIDTSSLPTPDPWNYLALQRSQALLAASNQTNLHPVRILFYGQSIIGDDVWSDLTSNQLRSNFGEANLIITNLAIDGLNAASLIKTAEADVYPFHPDLIICHFYGAYPPNEGDWEELLRRFRYRTPADVIVLGNHITNDGYLNEPTDPNLITSPPAPEDAEAWQNYKFAPQLVRELGFCFPDNRTAWKAFLITNGLSASALLKPDGIHLNDDGAALQFAIVSNYLKTPRLIFPSLDPFNNSRVKTHHVGTNNLDWESGQLKLQFIGNRVDVIAAPGTSGKFQVRIDGVPPTQLPSGRGHGRVTQWGLKTDTIQPGLLKVGFENLPEPQKWTLTVTSNEWSSPKVFFEISGSKTGFDGAGNSDEPFTSISRQVTIQTNDWFRDTYGDGQLDGNDNFAQFAPRDAKLEWDSELRAVDEYVLDPTSTTESVTTLINDLSDGPHVVELIADTAASESAIRALRTYHPGDGSELPGISSDSAGTPKLSVLRLGDQWLLAWPTNDVPSRLVHRKMLTDPGETLVPITNKFQGIMGALVSTNDATGFFSLEPPPDP